MSTNASQFERELREEIQAKQREFKEFQADTIGDVLDVAEARSPAGLKDSWGAALTRRGMKRARGGSGQARRIIMRSKPGATIFLGTSDFRAGWVEKGTRYRTTKGGAGRGRMPARPMLRVGIAAVARKERKA